MSPQSGELGELEKRCGDLVDIVRLLGRSLDKNIIIRRALGHVNERLGKRARYGVVENARLVIKYWIGDYQEDLQSPREVVNRSIVWKAFKEGRPVNLTNPSQTRGYKHTLKERVKIKAVVPLRYLDVRTQQEVKFGVLVVDSGPEQKPISAEEFEYLLIMADLIGEAVGKVELINELIRSYENRKELIKSMTHFLRNRFMVVGGFARRLHKKARDEDVKGYAQVISKEIGDIETYLHALEDVWREEEEKAGQREQVRR